MQEDTNPRASRRALALWWVNIAAGALLTLICAGVSAYLWLLHAGTVTQPAPLDREETAGQAFLIAVVAVVFAVLTTWLVVKRIRLPREEREAMARSWQENAANKG